MIGFRWNNDAASGTLREFNNHNELRGYLLTRCHIVQRIETFSDSSKELVYNDARKLIGFIYKIEEITK